VLLHVAPQLTGYTVKAMERKIERGDWIEGGFGDGRWTDAFWWICKGSRGGWKVTEPR